MKALSGGAGQAYRYLRKADDANYDIHPPGDPIADASARQGEWERYWLRSTGDTVQSLAQVLRPLRPEALEAANAYPAINVPMLRAALGTFAPQRGRGFDHFTPAELRVLPDEALSELAAIYTIMERSCIPPDVVT